jgi:phage terminase small subunit
MSKKVLSKQRQLFVEYYVAQGFKDATAAAEKAGYTPGGTHVTRKRFAFNLIHDPAITLAIEQALKERLRAEGLTPHDVLRTMLAIAMFDPASILRWDADGNVTMTASDDVDPYTRRAISRIKQRKWTDRDGNTTAVLEFGFVDKIPALTTLMEHLGLKQTAIPDGAPESVTIVINNRIADVPRGPDSPTE